LIVDKAFRHRVNAGRVALRNQVTLFENLRGQVDSQWKPDDTRVTFADFAISEKVFEEIKAAFPDDEVLSEESGLMDEEVSLESRYAWILDPIDGTNNYALGLSSCAISLALLKQGEPVYGFIYDGSTRQLIEGGPGYAIRLNEVKQVLPKRTFSAHASIIALHFPLPEGRADTLKPILEHFRVRSLGSAALHLAYVALGRLDGVFDERVRLWDIAAAVALLQAAGLEIRFLGNSPFPVRRVVLKGPYIQYFAGTPDFLALVQNSLG